MNNKMKCENFREKIAKYLSQKNVSGSSWQKCGRVAVASSIYGKPLCRVCAEDMILPHVPKK